MKRFFRGVVLTLRQEVLVARPEINSSPWRQENSAFFSLALAIAVTGGVVAVDGCSIGPYTSVSITISSTVGGGKAGVAVEAIGSLSGGSGLQKGSLEI